MGEVPTVAMSQGDESSASRRLSINPFVGLIIADRTAIELGLSGYILGAKIDHDIDKISYAEVYFRNLNPQLADDIRWNENQLMRIYIGYGNHPERASYQGAYRMSNPKFGYGVGSNIITMSGLGDGAPMINISRRRVFESMTYSQIVSEIVQEYGYTLQSNVNLKEVIPSMMQDGISDYAFVKKIADMAGVDFFIKVNNAFFMNPAVRTGVAPFVIRGNSPVVKRLEFSVEGDGQAAVISVSPVDPLTGKSPVISTQYDADGVLDVTGDGAKRFTQLAHPTVIYKDASGSLLSQTALQTIVNAEGAKRKQIVKVNGVIAGTEQIMPRKLVAFANCGSRFVGPFYITKVIHEVTSQNVAFITRFEGVRAATGNHRQAFGGGSQADATGGTPEPFADASSSSRIES